MTVCMFLCLQTDGMDEVAFQNIDRDCVTEKEPSHLPLGCSIRNLVKVRCYSCPVSLFLVCCKTIGSVF